MNRMTTFWRKVWRVNLPARIKMNAWRLYHDSLPDAKNMRKRGCFIEDSCWFCGFREETVLHLFRDCWISAVLGSSLGIRYGRGEGEINSAGDWIVMCSERMKEKEFRTFLCLLWVLWACRNERSHGKEGWRTEEIISKVQSIIYQCDKFCQGKTDKFWAGLDWGVDRGNHMQILCDGSWRRGDHRGGWGLVCREKSVIHMVQAGFLEDVHSVLGIEGKAICKGMLTAKEMGWEVVTLTTDSIEVAWALFSGITMKDGCKEWLGMCVNLLNKHKGWRVAHIMREQNFMADLLSRKSRIEQWRWTSRVAIPIEISAC